MQFTSLFQNLPFGFTPLIRPKKAKSINLRVTHQTGHCTPKNETAGNLPKRRFPAVPLFLKAVTALPFLRLTLACVSGYPPAALTESAPGCTSLFPDGERFQPD